MNKNKYFTIQYNINADNKIYYFVAVVIAESKEQAMCIIREWNQRDINIDAISKNQGNVLIDIQL